MSTSSSAPDAKSAFVADLLAALRRHGSREAITFPGGSWTYHEVWERVRAIAGELRQHEAGDTLVATLLPHGPDGIATVLAIWAAGATPLILDPRSDASATRQVVRHLAPAVLVLPASARAGRGEDARQGWNFAGRQDEVELWLNASREGRDGMRRRGQPGYVVLTSATGGEAKAVLGDLSGLGLYCEWQMNHFRMGCDTRMAHLAHLSFDFSFKETWPTLMAGGSILVGSAEMCHRGKRLVNWAEAERINMLCLLPSWLTRMVTYLENDGSERARSALPHLEHLLLSGEALASRLIRRWQRMMGDRVKVHNLYGPTESVVIRLFYDIPCPFDDNSLLVPLGHLVPYAKAWLCNERDSVGELVLGGQGIAQGYGTPNDNSQSFLLQDGVRCFKTGDLVRRDKGRYHFVCRVDRIVKRHGRAIDLSHLENVAREVPGVINAGAVDLSDDAYGTRIVLAYVGEGDVEIVLRRHIVNSIEAAGRPDLLVRVPAVPHTPRGKIDTSGLADVVAARLSRRTSAERGRGL